MTEGSSRTAVQHSCDLFCEVIDNFGDAGVAWRLARSLATERGWRVRLFIDELETLSRIVPEVDPQARSQSALGIEILAWERGEHADPGEFVIEAFGCTLPPAYVQRMAEDGRRRVWVNLEYLSAEDWVLGCHALPSPHPQLPLTKHFFFPGFVPGTGGVVIEHGLEARRQDFRRDPVTRGDWLAGLGATPHAEFSMFVFCYPSAPLADWAAALAAGAPAQLLLAPGAASEQLAQAIARLDAPQLSLVRLPYVPQEDFDQLLWAVDTAIVRGEDSFVRAQLGALPFAWHAYPQADAVHMDKFNAFADVYTQSMDPAAAAAWRGFSAAWNLGQGVDQAWPAFRGAVPALRRHAESWRTRLAALGSLTDALSDFAAEQLK